MATPRIAFPVLSFASLLISAGCASSPQQVAEADKQVVCEREYKLGSNIPVTTCHEMMSEEDRQRVVGAMRDTIRPAATQVVPKGP